MQKTEQITLTLNEFVASLALSGYDEMASQVLNEQELIKNESEFTRFVEETETSLRRKGYWDDNRNTGLAKGLEDLLYLLVHSKRKLRCIRMQNRHVLIIHSLNHKHSLIQHIQAGEHTFSFHQNKNGFSEVIRKHYGMEKVEIDVEGWQPIQMTDEMVDEIHTANPAMLHAVKQDENLAPPLRDFADDFLRNGQEFDNISFMESNYVKDQSTFDEIAFLLPGNNFVWHMNYDDVGTKQQVTFEPIPIMTYFKQVENSVREFFE